MPKSRVSMVLSQYIHAKGHRVDVVAPRMGLSDSQIYKYLEDETPFPLERLPSLYMACDRDEAMLNDLIAASTIGVVVTTIPAEAPTGRDLAQEALAVSGAAGHLASGTAEALADEHVSHAEAHELVKRAGFVVRTAQKLSNLVRRRAVMS